MENVRENLHLRVRDYKGVETAPNKRLVYGDNIILLANLESRWKNQISPINKFKVFE